MTGVVDPAPARQALLAFVLLGQLAIICSLGVVNLALPAIEEDLAASTSELQWIVIIQPLAYAVLLITGGRLGDAYGYRRVLLVGLVCFTLASVAAALAPTASFVVMARLIQGAAGGLTSPQVLAIIQTAVPPAQRAKAYAAFSMVGGAGFMIGQLGAGVLLDHGPLGWRLPFLMVASCSLVAAIGTAARYRSTVTAPSRPIDVASCLLGGVATVAVLYPLIQGRTAGWPPSYGVIGLAGVLLTVTFVRRQRRLTPLDRSLIDVTLFRFGQFRVGLGLVAVFAISSFAPFFVISYTLQRGFDLGATTTAIVTCGGPLAMVAAAKVSPAIGARIGRNIFVVGAILNIASAIAVLVVLRSSVSMLWLIPAIGFQGFGQGVFLPGLTNLTMAPIPSVHASAASSIFQTVQQFASAVGIACYGIVFFGALGDPTESGYTNAFAAVVPLVVLTAVALVLTSRRLPRDVLRTTHGPSH